MKSIKLLLLSGLIYLSGCATNYTTPGGSVNFTELADTDIAQLLNTKAAISFPANIAIARIQSPNYRSYGTQTFGTGRYSLVTTREVETAADFDRLISMVQVRGVAPLNKILLPEKLETIKALRTAAARLKADVLLIYTFDSSFQVGAQKYAPLNLISLGFLKNKEVSVTTTATAALFDVRTEFLYGIAEATEKQSKNASVWSNEATVDELRISAEKQAFTKLVPEIEQVWSSIVSEHTQ